jgi:ATP-binding cassette subfamily A (ABC1) protein 3
MEEAEALSTKMGIMVTGGVFKCFGSAQHIKNKFGTGYEIEIKIKKVTEPEINEVIAKFGLEKESKVPG